MSLSDFDPASRRHPDVPVISPIEWVSYGLAAAGLYAVLGLGLLAAVLAGLLIYELVQTAATRIVRLGVTNTAAKTTALTLLAAVLIILVALGVTSGVSQAVRGQESVVVLLGKMAEIVDTARLHLPIWAVDYVPANLQELETVAARWLREHAGQLQLIGRDIGKILIHIVIGMVIGGMVAFHHSAHRRGLGPLAEAIAARIGAFSDAFRQIVFSQIRISALNTFFTSIYLVIVLPAMGVELPLTKTMIAVTFVAGLLPVIGNLISNTVIVVVGLSVSLYAALGSLAFLVVIHKLEYFLNARIIGSRIKARAWELLVAMLVMEAWFGIPGLIAAPIYYAYLKEELHRRELI